ncbi:hypothetical protein G6L28_07930 [Agrobacterium larrymoorei]|uniref:hypothetical protein n=1 Tax=Agrobacterium larrymoorei TaxID=160699 RepID=UPI001573DC1A|nr:hypothetical protein [Agrobacterium larrymoorei]NTJ42528.1 hypothetical protein [Agrobacterium larrymoorei]
MAASSARYAAKNAITRCQLHHPMKTLECDVVIGSGNHPTVGILGRAFDFEHIAEWIAYVK